MSLVSGITFGGLLAYGAYQTSANPKNFIFLFGKFHENYYGYYSAAQHACVKLLPLIHVIA